MGSHGEIDLSGKFSEMSSSSYVMSTVVVVVVALEPPRGWLKDSRYLNLWGLSYTTYC